MDQNSTKSNSRILANSVLLCLFLALTSFVAGARDYAKADSTIRACVSQGIIPGAVLYVVDHGKTVYHKAYGNRQLVPVKDQPADMKLPIPMTEDVIFDMASCTKVVCTTTAIMQLWEKGLLDLEAPISRYLPEFEGQDITVTDLLTHTSGLPLESWRKYVDYDKYDTYGAAAPDSLVNFFAKRCPKGPRATKFEYSCPNFFLLHQIIVRLTGEDFGQYVQRNIFDPLDMKDSHFFRYGEPVPSECYSRIAPERRKNPIGVVDDAFARRICKGVAGNAGLYTTAEDMAKFCSFLMGCPSKSKVLSAKTIREMAKVVDPRFGRAIGWDVSSPNARMKGHGLSPSAIVHGGFVGTMLAIDLERKLAIVLLANRSHPDNRYYNEWISKREEINTYLGEK